MTGRTPPEWVGKNADTPVSENCKKRVYKRAESCCQRCGVRVSSRGQIDHVIPLEDWLATKEAPHGNRESNLQHLCLPCHRLKTGGENTKRAKVTCVQKTIGSPLAPKQSEWSKRYQAAKERGFNPWRK